MSLLQLTLIITVLQCLCAIGHTTNGACCPAGSLLHNFSTGSCGWGYTYWELENDAIRTGQNRKTAVLTSQLVCPQQPNLYCLELDVSSLHNAQLEIFAKYQQPSSTRTSRPTDSSPERQLRKKRWSHRHQALQAREGFPLIYADVNTDQEDDDRPLSRKVDWNKRVLLRKERGVSETVTPLDTFSSKTSDGGGTKYVNVIIPQRTMFEIIINGIPETGGQVIIKKVILHNSSCEDLTSSPSSVRLTSTSPSTPSSSTTLATTSGRFASPSTSTTLATTSGRLASPSTPSSSTTRSTTSVPSSSSSSEEEEEEKKEEKEEDYVAPVVGTLCGLLILACGLGACLLIRRRSRMKKRGDNQQQSQEMRSEPGQAVDVPTGDNANSTLLEVQFQHEGFNSRQETAKRDDDSTRGDIIMCRGGDGMDLHREASSAKRQPMEHSMGEQETLDPNSRPLASLQSDSEDHYNHLRELWKGEKEEKQREGEKAEEEGCKIYSHLHGDDLYSHVNRGKKVTVITGDIYSHVT